MSKLNGYAKGGGGGEFLGQWVADVYILTGRRWTTDSVINPLQELVTWMFGPRHLFRSASRSRGKQG
jgi:hypothetical protein